MRRHGELDAASRRILDQALTHLGLSVRAYDRVLKVARTIADLIARERIQSDHIAEAAFRTRIVKVDDLSLNS